MAKRTACEYTLTYHIPLTDSGWPLKHNIAYRTDTHKASAPTPIRKTYGDLTLSDLRAVYQSDGWTVSETNNGFRCEKDGYINEYADIRIVKY